MFNLSNAGAFLLAILVYTTSADKLPTCHPPDFHYEYTECDSEGGRWRVSVPKPDTCVDGAPNPPVRGKGCEFTCQSGQFLDINGDQECQPCPAGTYSLGGGLRFEDWQELPSGFTVKTESFSQSLIYTHNYSKKKDLSKGNCTETGWVPKGNYIASLAGGCSASLAYSVTLVRPGEVKFMYQYTDDDAVFHFLVQNSECQTVGDKDSNRWPSPTQEGEWKAISVSLKSGLNLLRWKTMGVNRDESTFKKPILVKNIEITGVAFTSECTKCRNGTFSHKPEGASYCDPCPRNTFSDRGAAECQQCTADKYSEPGSSHCKARPPCTDNDYFEYNSPCDANNQTQKMYKWIQPKWCRDDLSGAVPLPASGTREVCPPCNPGMEYYNGSCRFCTSGEYSDGIMPCQACSASTAPERGLIYKWWNNLPPQANVSSACLSFAGFGFGFGDESDTESGCATKTGWVTAVDHIHSGKGQADNSYLILSLKVGGFKGKEQRMQGKAAELAFVSFVFELECKADCTLFFMTQTASGGTAVIETWTGLTTKQSYSFAITKPEPITLSWAFQKADASNVDRTPSMMLRNDVARIYSINVTNTLIGGAGRCKLCPKGATHEGCVPCPAGHYIDPNTTQCNRCPLHTVVHGESPWGLESCRKCGPGLRAIENTKCVSDCHYKSPESGKEYDFSGLTSLQSASGSPLFTSSGTQYFHFFNISLCGNNERFPLATCHDNISYFEEKHNETADETLHSITKKQDDVEEVVSAIICRVTLIPPHAGDLTGVMAAQPVSLGDVLVNITTNASSLKMDQRMLANGFSSDGSGMDVHFTYLTEVPTSACRTGRTTVITLRCDLNQKGQGLIMLPPRCPDGTCDGCNYHFLWLSHQACPVCKSEDYEMVKGECIYGEQVIHYYPPKHCILQSGGKPRTVTKPCAMLPFWLQVAISVIVGLGVLLLILLLYCWKRNRKLEYKYSKLIENRDGKDGELPAADSCGLDEGEDDEQFDTVAFKESKGKAFFKKIKIMAKKDSDNPFERIQLTDKSMMT